MRVAVIQQHIWDGRELARLFNPHLVVLLQDAKVLDLTGRHKHYFRAYGWERMKMMMKGKKSKAKKNTKKKEKKKKAKKERKRRKRRRRTRKEEDG